VLQGALPKPDDFTSQRDFVRDVLAKEVDLRASGTQYVGADQETQASIEYRNHLNSAGSPTDTVAAGYQWAPGTELTRKAA
jgi:hypothetical protein